MPRLLHRSDIDDARWNATVDASTNPLPYGYTWHLDAMAPGWNALVEGDYEAVMPLTERKKYNVTYLYQPYFTQQLGVFSKHLLSDDITLLFLKELMRYRFIEVQWHYNHQPVLQFGFDFKARLTHHLTLDKPYDEISKNYHYSLRKNVRQAQKKNLRIDANPDAEWMIENFRLSKGKDVNELKDDDYNRLRNLIAATAARNCGNVYTVYNGEQKIASAFMLHNRRFIIPLFSFANDEGRALNAMSLLFDRMIHDHAQTDMIFDFEGSEIPSINAFNLHFGAQPVTYWRLNRNALPWHVRMIKRLKDAL